MIFHNCKYDLLIFYTWGFLVPVFFQGQYEGFQNMPLLGYYV